MNQMYIFLFVVQYFLMLPILSATEVPSILLDINATYANNKFNQVKPAQLSSIMLNDLENNTTLEQGLAAYEKLLPEYLAQTPIFTQSVFEENDVFQTNEIFLKYDFKTFMNASILHLRLLKHRKEMKLFSSVVDANLENLNDVANGSNSTIDYIYIITFYKAIFKEVEELDQDRGICNILNDNPPIKTEMFFNMLANEKAKSIALTEQTFLEPCDSGDQESYEQLMGMTFNRFKYYYNLYDKKHIQALRSGSKIEMKEFRAYVNQEKESITSYSTRAFLIYEVLKVKSQTLVGMEVDYSGLADQIGKNLALVAIPRFVPILGMHKNVIEQYDSLLVDCKNALNIMQEKK